MPKFTASDGVNIAYYVDDSTRPWVTPDTLLLLHAAMGSAKRFFAWVPRLCGHYRVVRWDMRGHGSSDVPSPDKPLSLERLVQDVVELLDEVGCGQAHIAGSSAGGMIAQNVAMMLPERVRSIMVFGAPPGLRDSKWPEMLKNIGEVGLRKNLSDNIRARLPVDRVDPKLVEWFIDQAEKLDLNFGGKLVSLMTSRDWSDELHKIRCPTLIGRPGEMLGGPEFELQYETMRQRIPNSQLVVYNGLPHHVTDSAPDRCVDDVLAFLRWHFGAP